MGIKKKKKERERETEKQREKERARRKERKHTDKASLQILGPLRGEIGAER